MIGPDDAIHIYESLLKNGIPVWLTGGWGIDALLGEQTRPHKDLDIIMLLDDVVRMRVLLESNGYHLKELWSENRQVMDVHGIETATAFVLWDSEGHELDAHVVRLDDQGNGFPVWEEERGFVFTKQDLDCEGRIDGKTVRCITPEKQMLCHTGYQVPEYQLRDLERLHKKFDIEYPDEINHK